MTGDYFVSEDIAQETFISAYKHFEDFDGNNEKAWICRIATNKCIDYLKSSARRIIPETEDKVTSLNYIGLIPYLVKQNQLQEQRIRNLETKIKNLEKAIEKLVIDKIIEGGIE